MENDDRAVVLIDQPDCLSCKHLVGDEIGTHKDRPCFEQDNCPAKFYRVAVGGEVLKMAKQLRRAQDSNDTDALIQILENMKHMDKSVENRIHMVAKGLSGVYDWEEEDEED